MIELRRLPRRDLQRLSSYLDGELPPKEAAKLEARLRSDSTLRAALDEMRGTVHLLRGLPKVRAPRNFTLTPEMAGVREPRTAYPFLRLATAMAMLAFLVTVGVDVLLPGPYGAAAPRAASESAALDMAQGIQATEQAEGLEAPPMALEALPQEEREAPESGEYPPDEEALGTALAAQVVPEEPQADKVAATPRGTEPGIGGALIESGTPQRPGGTRLPTPAELTAEAEGFEAPAPLGGGGDTVTPQALPMPTEAPQPTRAAPAPIRSVEVGLGALAMVLFGLTLLARRKPK